MNENTAVNLNTLETVEAAPAAPKRAAGRPADPNSRFAKAKAVYNDLIGQGKTRKEILVAIVALGLSEGSAAVYFHEAQKAAKAAVASV